MSDAPPMPDAALLTLAQWLSPAFPLGAFAYSHGLEWAISAGDVTDAGTLHDWIAAILTDGAGRADAILLAHALEARDDPGTLDALGRALAPSRERLAETLEQGAALARTTNALTGAGHPPRVLPVALGVAARGLGAGTEQVLALYLQSFAANLVQVGVRFIPVGQTEGQVVLARLRPVILSVASEASATPLDRIGAGALRADLAALHHETMDVRIYKT